MSGGGRARAPEVTDRRTAFILFRQHHQAEVAKNHPGLANPDISKIIGEYWQRSPAETKIRWKNLAEVCLVTFTAAAH